MGQGGIPLPFCQRPEVDPLRLIWPINVEQVQPLFPLLIKLFDHWLTFQQLLEVAKAYAPEVGFDLSSTSSTLIDNGFRLAIAKYSLYEDENGIVKPMRVTERPTPAKRPRAQQTTMEKNLIEDDDGWEQVILETVKYEGPISTDDAKERIRDQGGSDSWLIPKDTEDGEIEDKVGEAIDRLDGRGLIETDPDGGGWVIREQ